MKNDTVSDFLEVPHTADLAMKVTGLSLIDLFHNAENGLYALMGLVDDPQHLHTIDFLLPYLDDESLFVNYLNELLYYVTTGVAPRLIHMEKELQGMKFTTKAAKVLIRTRDIKAATFHNLTLKSTKNGFEAVIVLDV